jgi:hypothetical protein
MSPPSQYHQPATHTPQHHQHNYHGYIVKVSFDDAPEIVYGIAFRVRRIYDCNEPGQDCGKLESEDKVVKCDIPRFRSALLKYYYIYGYWDH